MLIAADSGWTEADQICVTFNLAGIKSLAEERTRINDEEVKS
jgi:hypothetical protein